MQIPALTNEDRDVLDQWVGWMQSAGYRSIMFSWEEISYPYHGENHEMWDCESFLRSPTALLVSGQWNTESVSLPESILEYVSRLTDICDDRIQSEREDREQHRELLSYILVELELDAISRQINCQIDMNFTSTGTKEVRLKAADDAELAGMLDALSKKGLARMTTGFSGFGDDGSVDMPWQLVEGGQAAVEEKGIQPGRAPAGYDLADHIQQWATEALNQQVLGWCNNSGSEGEIEFDAQNGKCEIRQTWYDSENIFKDGFTVTF